MSVFDANWAKDKDRFDRFMRAVKIILAPYVIDVADAKSDQEEATDLRTNNLTIAVRGRKAGYLSEYTYDIT